jgi:hypothetical protein
MGLRGLSPHFRLRNVFKPKEHCIGIHQFSREVKTMMGKTCGAVMGLLILIAGLALLAFGLQYLDGATAHILSGVLFALFGIGKLTHVFKMCPGCKCNCGGADCKQCN